MAMDLSQTVWHGVKLLIVGSVLFGVEFLAIIYFIKRYRCGASSGRGNSVPASKNRLISGSAKLASPIARAVRSLYEMFFEASADLGEVLLGRRFAKAQATVRSRLRP